MPTIAPATSRVLESGQHSYDFSLANGDATEEISGEQHSRAVLVADQVMQIQIPNGDATIWGGVPAGQAWWINPTASLAGVMFDFLPRRFRVLNASGFAGSLTVHLIPREARAGGAVAAGGY